MRILQRYITRDYLVTFALTVAIFTFVMCVGAFVKAIDLMSRGVSGAIILKVFLLNIPFMLQFTVPMSALAATLLLVSRLSLDGEITAMRACGLSLGQATAPLLAAAVGLALAALWISNWIAPASRHAQRAAMAGLSETDPIALLEEGRFVRDFPGLLVYVGKKDAGRIHDIVIYDFTHPRERNHVRARSGTVEYDADERRLRIRLQDVRVEKVELSARGRPVKTDVWSATEYPQDIDLRELLRGGKTRKKTSDQTSSELVAALREIREPYPQMKESDRARERTRLLVELNNRMALSMGCFAFTLVGIPLGIRSKRRESSVGIGLSLAIIFIFYMFMILARAMVQHSAWRPDLFPWIPVILAEIAGLRFLYRNG